MNNLDQKIEKLDHQLEGNIVWDSLHKKIYSTDASIYQIEPKAVAFPKVKSDLVKIILFCNENKISITPRTAGTSLAGQAIGKGIIIDFSKYFTKIYSIDVDKKLATVSPGVVRDYLNSVLFKDNLFFGPNTSTANRCMIGGMVANASSGTTSIKYGTARTKLHSLKAILSDGKEVTFEEIGFNSFQKKCKQKDIEGDIYREIESIILNDNLQKEIVENYPKASIHRRNTGYALDTLPSKSDWLTENSSLNIAKILAGSEGSLCLFTELTIHLDELPPTHAILIPIHFNSLEESLGAVPLVMEWNLYACELMDDTIMDCTIGHPKYETYRFFLEGSPKAVLFVELRMDDEKELVKQVNKFIANLTSKNIGYAYPIVKGNDIDRCWNLRKAGLGLLANISLEKKTIPCIEDTAVDINDLKDYINGFSNIMAKYGQNAVYYAHAGSGELHLRPIVNLKTKEGVDLFNNITNDVATLVKSFKGSMSGEHGDGRVRSAFIPFLYGAAINDAFLSLKNTFDPNHIFNPNIIVDPLPIDESFRDKAVDSFTPEMQFEGGYLTQVERCNGSGDCRKLQFAGGHLCPSYRATRDEKDTTRARANALRNALQDGSFLEKNGYSKEALDLCVSCKACSLECPSSVDMAALKSEFLHQYYKNNKRPLRDFLFSNFDDSLKLLSIAPIFLQKFLLRNPISNLAFKAIKLNTKKHFPLPSLSKDRNFCKDFKNLGKVDLVLLVDEISFWNDAYLIKDAYSIFSKMGKNVHIVQYQSGRALISKGFLKKVKLLLQGNLKELAPYIDQEVSFVGIEPSSILGFRDEYVKLTSGETKISYQKIKKRVFTFEEYMSQEIDKGNVDSKLFTDESKKILVHVHCHQKSLSSTDFTIKSLSLPKNYNVELIISDCCGMAGTFGYEAEHEDISYKMAHENLIPAIKKSKNETIICASGTSCRHQILGYTERKSMHPIEVLAKAINTSQ